MQRALRAPMAMAFSSALVVATSAACTGGGPTPSSPPCDQSCQDGVALRAFRETLKQVFNGALQGGPVGNQDVTYACAPLGGTAHVTGTATSNADVGTTSVNLTYVLDHCHYVAVDTDPNQNYDMTSTGTVTEVGVIAVQPGSTTSLTVTSDSMTFAGSVYSPPISFVAGSSDVDGSAQDAAVANACSVQISQNGNQLSGTICGRTAGVSL